MTHDLVFKGRAYIAGKLINATVLVDNGRITGIRGAAARVEADALVRLKSHEALFPGMIDIHVHMRDLEQSYKEDWTTGSMAALAGGVTFVADMPNTKPETVNMRALKAKEEAAARRSMVDYGLYFGFPEKIEELEKAAKHHILGVKLYPKDLTREEELENLLSYCAGKGILVIVHSEHPTAEPKSETEVTNRLLKKVTDKKGLRLHITHVSLKDTIKHIIDAKLSGIRVTFDVTPHHMFLTSSRAAIYGAAASVKPPLREEEDRSAIYNSVKAMLTDNLTTDHAPHTLEEKKAGAPGFPGLETALHLLLTKVLEGELPLEVVDLYSVKPARLIGVRKGVLAPGFDADFTVVDFKENWTIKAESFFSKARFTPFEGWTSKVKVVKTYVRGVLAYDKGEFYVKPGFGKLYQGRSQDHLANSLASFNISTAAGDFG